MASSFNDFEQRYGGAITSASPNAGPVNPFIGQTATSAKPRRADPDCQYLTDEAFARVLSDWDEAKAFDAHHTARAAELKADADAAAQAAIDAETARQAAWDAEQERISRAPIRSNLSPLDILG